MWGLEYSSFLEPWTSLEQEMRDGEFSQKISEGDDSC